MEDAIRTEFKQISGLLYSIDRTVYFLRIKNYDRGLRTSREVVDMTMKLIQEISSLNTYLTQSYIDMQEYVVSVLTELLEAQQKQDYVLLADLYELKMKEWLTQLQSVITSNEAVEIEEALYQNNVDALERSQPELAHKLSKINLQNMNQDGYVLEFSSNGVYTLCRRTKDMEYYFHSNCSPRYEAMLFAEANQTVDIDEIYIYGLGLGYDVIEMLQKDIFVEITVLESDLNIIQLACCVNDFSSFIESGRLKIIYDPEFKEFNQCVKKEDINVLIHEPSLKNIKNIEIRQQLEDYFIQRQSYQNQEDLMKGNFKKNVTKGMKMVDSLKDDFQDKTVFIVAAGPSLDLNFKQLPNHKDAVILATGTVFKKLLQADIDMDYVIVTDANPRVYHQIKGVEECKIPMLCLSTANYLFSKKYEGESYLIMQNGFGPAKDYAGEKHCNLYETGGSVTTTAIDVSVKLGAKRIVFVGLDLAYTDGFVHAKDTSRRDLGQSNDLRTVKDIYGKQIKTGRSLSIFKQWIEDYIKDHKEIDFIDATEGGAMIEGTKIMKLADVVKML